jgi:glutaconyl-CoA decarboxylase
MHGETAAVASYARRAVKDKDSGKPLEPLAQKMNEMAQKYHDTSRPAYSARHGFVDEIVDLKSLRGYLKAFAGAVYQNPISTCPRHQMLLPRIIKG